MDLLYFLEKYMILFKETDGVVRINKNTRQIGMAELS
jgi:hypothetical protein